MQSCMHPKHFPCHVSCAGPANPSAFTPRKQVGRQEMKHTALSFSIGATVEGLPQEQATGQELVCRTNNVFLTWAGLTSDMMQIYDYKTSCESRGTESNPCRLNSTLSLTVVGNQARQSQWKAQGMFLSVCVSCL